MVTLDRCAVKEQNGDEIDGRWAKAFRVSVFNKKKFPQCKDAVVTRCMDELDAANTFCEHYDLPPGTKVVVTANDPKPAAETKRPLSHRIRETQPVQ